MNRIALRSTKGRTAAVAALATAALGLPVALAAPASAVAWQGCTVKAKAPEFHNQWTTDGRKRIQYKLDVTCAAGVTITITDERYDADTTSADDLEGTSTLTNTFTTAGSLTRTITATLPDADPWGDDNEEMYHRARFKVTCGTVTSAYSSWDTSPTVTFHL